MTVPESFNDNDFGRQFEVRVHEVGVPYGGVNWKVPADSPLEAVRQVLEAADTISEGSTSQQLRQLGQDLLEIVGVTGIPFDYFITDIRVARACAAMGLSIAQGWEWVSRL